MKMAVCCVTARREGWYEQCVSTWGDPVESYNNELLDIDVVAAMQALYQRVYDSDLIFYGHDDLIIKEENWRWRALAEFNDSSVGVVGFGGSLGHGDPDIYKKPYHISQLGRSHYMSNVDDAEVHGERFTGARDVATVDGFALCVRRSLLERLGGWTDRLSFHGYDHWLTLSCRRLGMRTRLIGVRCHHIGGQTSVGMKADDGSHEAAHRWLYEEFRDVLPVWVNP